MLVINQVEDLTLFVDVTVVVVFWALLNMDNLDWSRCLGALFDGSLLSSILFWLENAEILEWSKGLGSALVSTSLRSSALNIAIFDLSNCFGTFSTFGFGISCFGWLLYIVVLIEPTFFMAGFCDGGLGDSVD